MSVLTRDLLVRADGGSRIGVGHLMRCLALAQRWQEHGGVVTFISCCDSDAVRLRIRSAGINFIDLEKSYPDAQDLQTVRDTLERSRKQSNGKPAWLVLDGYHFDSEYQSAIHSHENRLFVIDDTAHLTRYHADVILNQNINAQRLSYNCGPDTRLLLGSEYVLLRPEFLSWQRWQRPTRDIARRILVTLGGSDFDNVTLKVVAALKEVDIPSLEVKVVLGQANPHRAILQQAIDSTIGNMELIAAAENMPELMAWADVAVSAAGSTSWELAFMSVPSVLLTVADNQRAVALGMAEAGAAMSLGSADDISSGKIALVLADLMSDPAERARMATAARSLIDGNGAERAVSSMRGFDNDRDSG